MTDDNMRCLKALCSGPTDPRSDYHSLRHNQGRPVSESCEWILKEEKYISWLNEQGPQLLCLHGAPGMGKTTLSLFLIDELTKLVGKSSNTTVAFFLCDATDHRRRTLASMLRGLLTQILKQRSILFGHIQETYEQRGSDLLSDQFSLWEILVAILQDANMGRLYLVLDALDECDTKSHHLLLSGLERLLGTDCTNQTRVKIVLTSRSNNVSQSIPSTLSLHIDSEMISGDLKKFINSRVNEISLRQEYPENLRESIKTVLLDRAGGTFLWASMSIQVLYETRAFEAIEKLEDVPKGLNQLYDRILCHINDELSPCAQQLLQIVAVAQRPLYRQELGMALMLSSRRGSQNEDFRPEEVQNWENSFKICQPLIYHDSLSGMVKFTHLSVKRYLQSEYLKTQPVISQYHVNREKANLLMFEACWKSIHLLSLRERTTAPRLPLTSYALSRLIFHAFQAREELLTRFNLRTLVSLLPSLHKWLVADLHHWQEGEDGSSNEALAGVEQPDFDLSTSSEDIQYAQLRSNGGSNYLDAIQFHPSAFYWTYGKNFGKFWPDLISWVTFTCLISMLLFPFLLAQLVSITRQLIPSFCFMLDLAMFLSLCFRPSSRNFSELLFRFSISTAAVTAVASETWFSQHSICTFWFLIVPFGWPGTFCPSSHSRHMYREYGVLACITSTSWLSLLCLLWCLPFSIVGGVVILAVWLYLLLVTLNIILFWSMLFSVIKMSGWAGMAQSDWDLSSVQGVTLMVLFFLRGIFYISKETIHAEYENYLPTEGLELPTQSKMPGLVASVSYTAHFFNMMHRYYSLLRTIPTVATMQEQKNHAPENPQPLYKSNQRNKAKQTMKAKLYEAFYQAAVLSFVLSILSLVFLLLVSP